MQSEISGGTYIPPAKLMQSEITDKSSAAYQRLSWEALKKSIHGSIVNKVNKTNIGNVVRDMFSVNLIRGRGLLAKSIIVAQAASPTYSAVYASLLAIINTRFPAIGELVLKRLITDFKKAFRRNQKAKCLSATQFIAHLVNQQVCHEIISLEILSLLLEQPTDDSVEVAIGLLKEVGAKLTELSPRGMHALFDRLRSVLNESKISVRVQYMIETMFQIRKDNFKDFPSVLSELDLVEEDDQITHMMTLDEDYDVEETINVFKFDDKFLENEEKYKAIRDEILGGDDESGSGDSGSSGDESEAEEETDEKKQDIVDNTETNLVQLRRTIYLIVQSSLSFEEAAHKLVQLQIKPGQEYEVCNMIMDCCAQLRTYEKFYGLLAQRFCTINKRYIEEYEKIFAEQYNTIHRLELVKLRNVAKFFAHLLHTDSISWGVLQVIKLNEDDTTSSSRIFIKILFQELSEFLGMVKLNERLNDPTLQCFFEGVLPKDNPRDTRFSINFFTSIGLGGLTLDLRDHLKEPPKAQKRPATPAKDSDSSESDSSSSGEETSRKKKRHREKRKKKTKHRKKKSKSPQRKRR